MPRYIEVYVDELIRETDSALLVLIDGDEHWIPRSQIDDSQSDELEVGEEGTLWITQWIADQREIEA